MMLQHRSGRSAAPDHTGRGPIGRAGTDGDSNRVLALALGLALAVHLLIILGIRIEYPRPSTRVANTVEVVVLHQAGPRAVVPDRVAAPAQTTQSGSGEGWRDATTRHEEVDGLPEPLRPGVSAQDLDLDEPPPEAPAPTPVLGPVQAPKSVPEPVPDQVPPLAPAARPPAPDEALALTAELAPRDTFKMPARPTEEAPPAPQVSATQILASRDRELARLAARIDEKTSVFGNRPRRTSVSSSTKEYKYATYLEGWRRKVEQIGNLNYPEEARRQRLYGSLILRVAVRTDGSVEQVQVLRSSGFKVLDEAAVHIVELAGPYAPFPPDIAAETDILDITRTWQFQRNNQLGWGN